MPRRVFSYAGSNRTPASASGPFLTTMSRACEAEPWPLIISLLLSIELDAALTEAGHSKEWAPVFFLYFTGAGCMPPVVQAGL
jgi:hypothetical protein